MNSEKINRMNAATSNQLANVSLTLEQVGLFKREVLQDRPYFTRVSFSLVLRMMGMAATGHEYFAVIDELDFLEEHHDISAVVAATQFKHAPLHPLWHKHFFTARHLVRNIMDRWGMHGTAKEHARLIKEVAAECGGNVDLWPAVLVDRLVVNGYMERARTGEAAKVRETPTGEGRECGLTGDWIIYGKHEGMNYYLDLAKHEEGNEPEQLMEKLRLGCAAEYPFIFKPEGKP